MDSIEKYIIV